MRVVQYDDCECGETLVTRDEVDARSCWHCSHMSERISILDIELASLLPRPAAIAA